MSILELSDSHKKLYDGLVTECVSLLKDGCSASDITMLIATGIKYLSKVKTLSGLEKKNLVLYAVKDAINKAPHLSSRQRTEAIFLIDTFGDSLIDSLVDLASKAYLYIKSKFKGKFKGKCTCLSFCKSSKTANTRDFADTEYSELIKYIHLILQRPVSAQKIVLVVAASVKFVAQYGTLTGAEKKALVIRAIRDVISESGLKSTEIEAIYAITDSTIDHLVDFGKALYLKKRCLCF